MSPQIHILYYYFNLINIFYYLIIILIQLFILNKIISRFYF